MTEFEKLLKEFEEKTQELAQLATDLHNSALAENKSARDYLDSEFGNNLLKVYNALDEIDF